MCCLLPVHPSVSAALLVCFFAEAASEHLHHPGIPVLPTADALLSDGTRSSSAEDTNVSLDFLSFLEIEPK